jgi:hypothetical protein
LDLIKLVEVETDTWLDELAWFKDNVTPGIASVTVFESLVIETPFTVKPALCGVWVESVVNVVPFNVPLTDMVLESPEVLPVSTSV